MTAIPTDKGDTYSSIKKLLLCSDTPFLSQNVVLSRSLKKEQQYRAMATKILIQMMSKMGGAPWNVKIPTREIMVVGFDTYHDTATAGNSVGALVSSLDPEFSRYFSKTTTHRSCQEMSDNLHLMMIEAVKKYRDANAGKMPKKIIFYRCGGPVSPN